MRAYSAASQEALRARAFLKDWLDEGFLTESQYQRTEQETICDLRCTNVFLRLVLFLFTLIIVGAASGLILTIFFSTSAQVAGGVGFILLAAASYAGAEFAVSEYRLYRYGIEEALAACSVGFLCAGLAVLLSGHASSKPDVMEFVVPFVGAAASLWVWRRFGLAYFFLAAMVFAVWLSRSWTSSHSAQHLILATIYSLGLVTLIALRFREKFTYVDEEYSIAEALLWLGFYFAINLQISPLTLFEHRFTDTRITSDFSRSFYWFTWALTWCVPPAVLWRGLHRKDRFVIAVGGIVSVLTLITNKSYLGWQRHTWDPMLLGILLVGIAVAVHRWLSSGPRGVRHGFTARRLSMKDKRWMDVGSVAFGVIAPSSTTMHPQTGSSGVRFGGGESGGGGASSDF